VFTALVPAGTCSNAGNDDHNLLGRCPRRHIHSGFIAMEDCDLDTSVPDWVIEHPETLAVFQTLGIDYSCGGKSLRYACQERGLHPESVIMELSERLNLKVSDEHGVQKLDDSTEITGND
jgi:regulator of cell morphogenesis and NO signaling